MDDIQGPAGRPPRSLVVLGLILSVMIVSAVMTAFTALGAVLGVTIQLATPADTPHPYLLALMSGAILIGLSSFFGMVTKRLYAGWRANVNGGRSADGVVRLEPAHLMPPWLSVTFAALIGLAGLGGILFSASARSGPAIGYSLFFLGYAVMTIWRRVKKLRKRGL